jgi:hypothetical protein
MKINRTLLNQITWVTVAISISGCAAAPTRGEQGAFFVVQQGQVDTKDVNLFVDCLMDGFDKSHDILTNVHVRQQRRVTGYRVESLTNSIVHVSADVFDTGIVVLNENKTSSLIITKGEKEAFSSCLSKH